MCDHRGQPPIGKTTKASALMVLHTKFGKKKIGQDILEEMSKMWNVDGQTTTTDELWSQSFNWEHSAQVY